MGSIGSLCLGVVVTANAMAQTSQLTSPNSQFNGGFGVTADGVPDVNGDGRGDMIVGAPFENIGFAQNAGRAYLYSGRNGVRLRSFRSPGPELNGQFGLSVAGLPDINGDGAGDIAIGAPGEVNGVFPGSGRVYVFSGATGALLYELVSPGQGGRFGESVAAVPDTNGDGIFDIAVGSPREGTAPLLQGRVYLFSGANGQLLRTFSSPNPEAGGLFGQAVDGIFSVNNNDSGEVIIGAPNEDLPNAVDGGRVYLFDGGTGALLRTLVSPNPRSQGAFGAVLSGLPDATGDNRDEVIVGSPGDTVNAALGAGQVYVFHGATGARLYTLRSSNPQPQGNFGASVAGVTDTGSDGRGDILVGAVNEANVGRIYLFSGANGVLVRTISSLNATIGGQFGGAVAGVPDVNNDDRTDILVGAPGEPSATTTRAGRAYLFRSVPSPGPGGPDPITCGSAPGRSLGIGFADSLVVFLCILCLYRHGWRGGLARQRRAAMAHQGPQRWYTISRQEVWR